MTLEHRIRALSQLSRRLETLPKEELEKWTIEAKNKNAWFTKKSIEQAIISIISVLKKEKLEEWTTPYTFNKNKKKVGIIMAGNIPLVGFHDLIAVIISGHIALIKSSSQDNILMPKLTSLLCSIQPQFTTQIQYTEKLVATDAIIATGSDNSARYFKKYFGSKPHILRKSSSSYAILTGQETNKEINDLGKDIFTYYGLGCRNVSKLFVPQDYNFIHLLDQLEQYKDVGMHHKWANNYIYNKSIYLVNKIHHLDNGFLLLKESDEQKAPLSVLFYQKYSNIESIISQNKKHRIQCIVSNSSKVKPSVKLGQTQSPNLWDYADGIDTLLFLESI